jgi:membrane associated rhomboid family serine protease
MGAWKPSNVRRFKPCAGRADAQSKDSMKNRERIFNLPAVIVWCGGAIVVLHLARLALSDEADIVLIYALSFIPARYGELAALYPGGVAARYWTPLTYALLHADGVHLAVNMFWMAAFGSAVARRLGAARFLVLSVAATLAGALAHLLAYPGDEGVMIGASGAVSGMTAAAARFAFMPGGPLGSGRGRSDAFHLPAPPSPAVLGNRNTLIFIGVWFAINLVFGVQGALLPGVEGAIAWQAHIGGFLAGFLLFGFIDPVPHRRAAP